MSDYNTYTTSNSSVTGSRDIKMETVTVSGIPSVTYVRPYGPRRRGLNFPEAPYITLGYTGNFMLQGYNFLRDNLTVYISAGPDVYTSHPLSGISLYDMFGQVSSLSSQYPPFSGYKLPVTDYTVETNNTMRLLLSAAQNTGKVEIILVNVRTITNVKYYLVALCQAVSPIIILTTGVIQ